MSSQRQLTYGPRRLAGWAPAITGQVAINRLLATPVLSVVTPVLNEGDHLLACLEELVRVARSVGRSFELICVDGAGTDVSAQRLMQMRARTPELRVLRLVHRGGRSAALAAGIRAARGRLVALTDAELPAHPAELPRMFDLLETRPELGAVLGWRRQPDLDSGWAGRLLLRVVGRLTAAICGQKTPRADGSWGLQLARTELLRNVPAFRGMHRYIGPLVRMAGGQVLELPDPLMLQPIRAHFDEGVWRRAVSAVQDALGVRWLLSRRICTSALEQREPEDEPPIVG